MPLPNPILRGCYPDPSICRVGDDHFLITSSFTMHPGLPIHRSRDLVSWELVGHVLEGSSWIPLDDVDSSDGVWAPTIRYHHGSFYVVFALARGRTGAATYVCTSSDPAGPWEVSEVEGADGIDPSLFFDDDGTCWFTAARDSTDPDAYGPGEIWVQEFDTASLRLIGPKTAIWHGALAHTWVEAPHIYRRGDGYHLIAAEGGTEFNHSITAARAAHPLGPWTTDPRSPLLTHRHLGRQDPVQNVGHGDIVEGTDGAHWGVVLGVRSVDGLHTLGRETFLVPVAWDDDGPVFAPGEGRITIDPEDDVDPAAVSWVSLRGPARALVEAESVRLAPSPVAFDDVGVPGFLGVRQAAHVCRFEATVDPAQSEDQHSGIVAFQNERHHVAIEATGSADGSEVRFIVTEGGRATVIEHADLRGEIRMRIAAEKDSYRFDAHSVSEPSIGITAAVPRASLSTEVAGGFVGVLLGVYHRGRQDSETLTFRDVRYRTGGRERPRSRRSQLRMT